MSEPGSPSAASYMLFDRASGNAVNGYDDAGEAQDALRRSVEANPDCVETLVLIPFDSDGMPCGDSITFADLPASPSAAKERAGDSVTTLREHLSALSLGGGHPYVVVVPRDELGAVLDELDELREYQTQQEELIRRGR